MMSKEKRGQKQLNNVQIELLRIMEAFMHGAKACSLPENFTQIQELYSLSQVHHVSPIVYEMIRGDQVLAKPELQPLQQHWKMDTVRQVMFQIQRTDGFLSLYRKFTESGLRPLVVKGIVCRNLYIRPDYRISGDEDILVRKKDFPQYDHIFQEEGFVREKISEEKLPHEITYINRQSGVYIEMHFSLFSEESGAYGHLNREFSDAFRSCICERIQDVDIWTLNPTLHLFYLICHGLKHFLHSGFGIRQLCDMVMMAEHYGERIDWQYIEGRLRALRMDVFWNGLAAIGRDYLGMSWEKTGYPDHLRNIQIDYQHLLLDLLESGVFGNSSMERKHSSNMTLAAARSGRKDTAASLKASLFPGMEYMKRNYRWLERYPILLPAAWMMRMNQYLSARKKPENGGQQTSVAIGMDRVKLLREYHIID